MNDTVNAEKWMDVPFLFISAKNVTYCVAVINGSDINSIAIVWKGKNTTPTFYPFVLLFCHSYASALKYYIERQRVQWKILTASLSATFDINNNGQIRKCLLRLLTCWRRTGRNGQNGWGGSAHVASSNDIFSVRIPNKYWDVFSMLSNVALVIYHPCFMLLFVLFSYF